MNTVTVQAAIAENGKMALALCYRPMVCTQAVEDTQLPWNLKNINSRWSHTACANTYSHIVCAYTYSHTAHQSTYSHTACANLTKSILGLFAVVTVLFTLVTGLFFSCRHKVLSDSGWLTSDPDKLLPCLQAMFFSDAEDGCWHACDTPFSVACFSCFTFTCLSSFPSVCLLHWLSSSLETSSPEEKCVAKTALFS